MSLRQVAGNSMCLKYESREQQTPLWRGFDLLLQMAAGPGHCRADDRQGQEVEGWVVMAR